MAEYAEELARRIDAYVNTWADDDLRAYLSVNSRLPGPRANLELAAAFTEAVRDREKDWRALWTLCTRWTSIPPEEAPVNDPREFVVFCGARGIGSLGTPSPPRAREALVHLRVVARDPRWRVRESVAIAVQDLVEHQPGFAMRALEDWIAPGAWLEMRAVAAGVAEPRLLDDRKVAKGALAMHQDILRRVRAAKERDSDGFRTLRQGLAYSVSVVVAARSDEGFRWMMKLADSKDPDVQWILKENLKKGRLVSRFPGWVERIQATMRRR
jgi:hypothetical protein